MKILLMFTLVLPAFAFAQVDLNELQEGTTTIEVTKGKKAEETKPTWEVHEGQADIEGESSATNKEAKAAWKKACEDWKKEFRADNKDNKILSMSCGTSTCDGEVGQKTCVSKASYKVKTRVD